MTTMKSENVHDFIYSRETYSKYRNNLNNNTPNFITEVYSDVVNNDYLLIIKVHTDDRNTACLQGV